MIKIKSRCFVLSSSGSFRLSLAAAVSLFLALGITSASSESASAQSIETAFPGASSTIGTSHAAGSTEQAGSFSPAASAPAARLKSPLSGSVRVIDQLSKPATRLRRLESNPFSASPSSGQGPGPIAGQGVAGQGASEQKGEIGNSVGGPASGSQSGGLADSGLQALFPSKDTFNPPPALNGFANSDVVKPKKKHVYIWNMSLAGGYYDVTNTFQGVVPGNKLYLYGGFMADGHTPVPNGPVPMNAGGHIRWTPAMGEAPQD
jgi:hypothetical protein